MLYYEIKGTGDKYLVLLHGFMENSSIWEEMEDMLLKKFKIIMIDLPGHGKSPHFDDIYTMEYMADKVFETLNALNINNINLLGHSMGGYVALAFAEKFASKLNSITLFFSSTMADSEEKKEVRNKSIKMIEEDFVRYVNLGVPNLFNQFEIEELEEKINITKGIAISTKPKTVISAIKGMILRPNRTNVLNNLNFKVLLISGNRDLAISYNQMHDELEDKQNIKKYVLDTGHCGHFECPEICASIILKEI